MLNYWTWFNWDGEVITFRLRLVNLLGRVFVVGKTRLWLIPNPSAVKEVNLKLGEASGVRAKIIELTTSRYWRFVEIVPPKVIVKILPLKVHVVGTFTEFWSIEQTIVLEKLSSLDPVSNSS